MFQRCDICRFFCAGFSGKSNVVLDSRNPYLTVPALERIPWLVHGFGTAGWQEADFARSPRLRDFRPIIMHQLHSDTVHRLDAAPRDRLNGDALITNVPGLLLIVRTADCLPVLLVDEARRAVAAVHCGWRGTRSRILEKVTREMLSAYGSRPADLLAALGPCIGPCCYEVGPEVRASFLEAGFPPAAFHDAAGEASPRTAFHSLLDLRAANVWLLESLGVPPAGIFGLDACTRCEPRLVSYRRNRNEKRRLYNFIGINLAKEAAPRRNNERR